MMSSGRVLFQVIPRYARNAPVRGLKKDPFGLQREVRERERERERGEGEGEVRERERERERDSLCRPE